MIIAFLSLCIRMTRLNSRELLCIHSSCCDSCVYTYVYLEIIHLTYHNWAASIPLESFCCADAGNLLICTQPQCFFGTQCIKLFGSQATLPQTALLAISKCPWSTSTLHHNAPLSRRKGFTESLGVFHSPQISNIR